MGAKIKGKVGNPAAPAGPPASSRSGKYPAGLAIKADEEYLGQ
jgi:hypothetical protein